MPDKITRKKSADAPASFEDAMTRLEEINAALEDGEPSLDDAIALYTEGMELVKFCQTRLSDAENRIKVILEKNGAFSEEDFDAPR